MINCVWFSLLLAVSTSGAHAALGKPNPCIDAFSIKSRWQVQADDHPWTWTAPKRLAAYKGHYELTFSKTGHFIELPSELSELSSVPWYELYPNKSLRADEISPSLQTRPLLEIKVIDTDGFYTQHATLFTSLKSIVRAAPAGTNAVGMLDVSNIRWTNSAIQPAFYTQIDHTSSLLVTHPPEALLKIKVTPQKGLVVLSLNEPLTDEERSFALSKLSGQNDFWTLYQAKNEITNYENRSNYHYDYDLFQSAVVSILREKYGITPDLMLYLKTFTARPMNVGNPQTMVYAWPIFYNPKVLEGALVEKMFYEPNSQQPSTENGVNDWKYAEMSPDFRRLVMDFPEFVKAMEYWKLTTPYFALQKKICPDRSDFWLAFYPTLTQFLVSQAGREILEELESKPTAPSEEIIEWIRKVQENRLLELL